eukprot:477622-Pyramimonas_sp.AAC.1
MAEARKRALDQLQEANQSLAAAGSPTRTPPRGSRLRPRRLPPRLRRRPCRSSIPDQYKLTTINGSCWPQ